MAQVKTFDMMKDLPQLAASKIAKEIQIEKDKTKLQGLKQ